MSSNVGLIDALIILLYLGTLTGIGVYFARRQKSLEQYFLASKSMGWLPVGMSLMAALNSGLDYLGGPFSVFKYGLIFLMGTLSWLFVYPWVAYVALPFFRRLEVVTAYEYLEQRFNGGVRTLASVIFLLWRFGWMSIALYVPALVVSETTGLPYVPTVIFLGGLVTLYTMLGGITAIIWTDVLQFCIMLLGVVVTVIVAVGKVDGGVAGVFGYAAAHGGMRLVTTPPAGGAFEQLRFLFTDETSVVGIMLSPIIGRMTMYTCEQSMIQRFKATRSVEDSRRAFIINAVGDAVWSIGLAFVGLALFAFYAASIGDPGRLPTSVQEDTLTTYFMRQEFPTGLNGLVVAAVLASGLSAIDAAISASTSVVMVDFYNRMVLRRASSAELTEAESRAEVKTSRIVTVMVAAVGILLAANVPALGKNIIQLMNTVIQTFTGPLFALFLLGMFSERARGGPVLLGGWCGTLVAMYLSQTKLWGELLGRLLGQGHVMLPGEGIGFIWPTVFGGVTVLVVGWLASALLPGEVSEEQKAMTWWKVVRRPVPDSNVDR